MKYLGEYQRNYLDDLLVHNHRERTNYIFDEEDHCCIGINSKIELILVNI